jgi:exopolyphosphatase / guanosine-5'-triphosphate,3'-diphosphate pyrophosphatase
MGMRPDRADVIVPACEIYLHVMKHAGVEQIVVPKVGLSDGIVLKLYAEWRERSGLTHVELRSF